jgi:hypothetical protein
MVKKNLAVLGVGTAGIQTLSHFLAHLDDSWTITSIYDPNIPILGIGESTNPSFIAALELGAEFNFHDELENNYLDSTLKLGTFFTNWRDTSYLNPLLGAGIAIHINTFKLKNWAIPRFKTLWGNKFIELHGNITHLINNLNTADITINEKVHSFDYVIDCRGFPKDISKDYIFVNNPTNHCLVHNVSNKSDFLHTKHTATKDGWMFVVPLKSRTSYGYLFNDKLTDITIAKDNFSKEINVPLTELDNIEYVFKSYYTDKLIDGRIAKNGNNAAFFEPMFANSLWLYDSINRFIYDFIVLNDSAETINNSFINKAKDIEEVICMFYQGGSLFNTPFWKTASNYAKERLKTSIGFKNLTNANLKASIFGVKPDHDWVFSAKSWKIIYKNMGYK